MDISTRSHAASRPNLSDITRELLSEQPRSVEQASKQKLYAKWEKWAAQAPAGSGEYRDKALILLKDCMKTGCPLLDLQRLNLSSLPNTLPPHIESLDVSENNLTQLSVDQLKKLRELTCNCNPDLTTLSGLQEGLEKLYAAFCSLTNSPVLPSTLVELHLGNNLLTTLPALPPTLVSFYANNNQLSSLTVDIPEGLNELHLYRNLFTEIPDGISKMSTKAHVNLRYNALSSESIDRSQQTYSDPNYQGPKILYTPIN